MRELTFSCYFFLMNKDGLKTLLDSRAVGRSDSQEGKKLLEGHDEAFSTTLKFLMRVLHFLFFFGIFSYLSKYIALLRPSRLFIFGESSHLHCFLRNEYQTIPTYTPLLISEKTFLLHGY